MASKFGDCDYKEFIAICEQHKLAGINRTRWVDLFERAAGAAGRRARPEEAAKLIAFIKEGRKGAGSVNEHCPGGHHDP
jgi:hypothetical protein